MRRRAGRAASGWDRKFEAFYEAYSRALSTKCAFIDSRPFAHYPDTGGDGVHFDGLGPEGKRMGEALAGTSVSVTRGESLYPEEPPDRITERYLAES